MAPKKKAAAKAVGAKEPEVVAEPEKRKAEEVSTEEAPKKVAKIEVKEEEKAGTSESEKDAPPDKRAAIKEAISFSPQDTTLNVIPTMGGKVLMSLSEGGMQYLVAGARANVGMKAGRYMFEVRIVEALSPTEASTAALRSRVAAPRQLLKVGFSTAGSPLVLGESEDAHVCFDAEGNFCAGRKKKLGGAQKFTRDQVVGVLLNLDPSSPNANTLSLFRDGERISEPQPIPESLHGKTLFPHISFRNISVQVTFGAQPTRPLPFKCRGLGGAAQADVVATKKVEPNGGKCEVVVPVAFPDEGTFDWLDAFLAKNPDYVELSDRKILEWATSSGVMKGPKVAGSQASNDKPLFNFGLPALDDFSVQRVLQNVTSVIPRNYVVMEVKSNLIQAERQEVLKRFSPALFKRVAHVVMGEPNDEFKKMQLEKLLQEKQEKAMMKWKAKQAEMKRKKEMDERQKALMEMKKKADETRKKVADEAKKKAQAALKKVQSETRKAEAKKKAEEAGEEYVEEEDAEEEPKEEEDVKVEVKEEEEKKADEMEVDEEEGPPVVELTEEEKNMWFRPPAAGISGDLAASVLNLSFGKFSIPESSEGFDDIRFEWQGAEASRAYVHKWVVERKRTSRIEELEPGEWFLKKNQEWMKLFADWQAKQRTFKNSQAKELAAKELAAKKRKEAGEEDLPEEDAVDDGDLQNVADVNDTGKGEPLYKDFTFEDWALLQLRYELHLLQIAFKKDVADPERAGVHDTHMAFYYTKYFKKTLSPKAFAVSDNTELTTLVKDAIGWGADEKVLTTTLEEDAEPSACLKMSEDNRRERQRRIDAGDETARLKFMPAAISQPSKALAFAPAGPAGVPMGALGGAPAGAFRPPLGNPAAKQWGGKGAIHPQMGGFGCKGGKGAW